MRMTTAEKLILTNQRVIMLALRQIKETSKYHDALDHQMLNVGRVIEAARTWNE